MMIPDNIKEANKPGYRNYVVYLDESSNLILFQINKDVRGEGEGAYFFLKDIVIPA